MQQFREAQGCKAMGTTISLRTARSDACDGKAELTKCVEGPNVIPKVRFLSKSSLVEAVVRETVHAVSNCS